MKISAADVKKKLFSNGSPIFAVMLFAAAFFLTVTLMKSCTYVEIDRFQLGQEVREIVDGEDGEEVATINGVSFTEKDLKLIIEGIKLSEPQYMKLEQKQIDLYAGNLLIEENMLLMEFDRLGLVITDAEFEEYLANEKLNAANLIKDGSTAGSDFLNYVSGYGCSYEEYWLDGYVRDSFLRTMKIDMIKTKISNEKGSDEINEILVAKYLTALLDDGTYVVTLFGEEFK